MSGPIVVGVDGTAEALRAVRWAAAYAGLRDTGLRLAHARAAAGERVPDELRAARAVVDEVVPGMPVTAVVEEGLGAELLVRASAGAAALVLGSPGHGGYFGGLIGPTVVAVAARAQCPMVVVSGSANPGDGPVVVGLDCAPTSEAAVAFAAREAALRGVDLVAVHGLAAPDDHRDRAEKMVTDLLARQVTPYPDVKVVQEIVVGRPGAALLDRALSAQLVVVGSGRRTGYRGALLRSTSQLLLHNASCPVAIVRRDHPT